MLIQEKIGHINSFQIKDQTIDLLPLERYESRKRILRKQTSSGKEVSLKFMNENPELTEGDVLYADEITIILVSILPCNCIVMQPKNMFEMASMCYEIGNRHPPLFYESDELMVPFETPFFNLLLVQGYAVLQEERKLLKPLKTTIAPHTVGISDNVFPVSIK